MIGNLRASLAFGRWAHRARLVADHIAHAVGLQTTPTNEPLQSIVGGLVATARVLVGFVPLGAALTEDEQVAIDAQVGAFAEVGVFGGRGDGEDLIERQCFGRDAFERTRDVPSA